MIVVVDSRSRGNTVAEYERGKKREFLILSLGKTGPVIVETKKKQS